jgi:hypothetical protein
MSYRSRTTTIVMTAAAALAITKAALPMLLTWVANIAVRKLPGVSGTIRWVQINFMAPGLAIRGITLDKLNGDTPEHRIEVGSIAIEVNG